MLSGFSQSGFCYLHTRDVIQHVLFFDFLQTFFKIQKLDKTPRFSPFGKTTIFHPKADVTCSDFVLMLAAICAQSLDSLIHSCLQHSDNLTLLFISWNKFRRRHPLVLLFISWQGSSRKGEMNTRILLLIYDTRICDCIIFLWRLQQMTTTLVPQSTSSYSGGQQWELGLTGLKSRFQRGHTHSKGPGGRISSLCRDHSCAPCR